MVTCQFASAESIGVFGLLFGSLMVKCLSLKKLVQTSTYRFSISKHQRNIGDNWVVWEYLYRCKSEAWKEENIVEALKCWNLENIIDLDALGKPDPKELTMDDILKEVKQCVTVEVEVG